jgi:hypothetical protein
MNKTTSSDTQYTQIQQTHYKGCWVDPKHHACALVEIERLRAHIAELGEADQMTDVLAIIEQRIEPDRETAELRDEISALRAALVSIARTPGADNETAYEMRKIAREALGDE